MEHGRYHSCVKSLSSLPLPVSLTTLRNREPFCRLYKIRWTTRFCATDHVCKDRSAIYSIKPCASPTRYRTAGDGVTSEEKGIVAKQLPDSKKLV